jgi:hypothetical protein
MEKSARSVKSVINIPTLLSSQDSKYKIHHNSGCYLNDLRFILKTMLIPKTDKIKINLYGV